MFQIPIVGGGRTSPSGDRVIYRLGRVDNFKDNQYELSPYLYDSKTDQTRQLADARMVYEVRWLDNQTAALLISEGKDGFQIHVLDVLSGEDQRITDHKGGIEAFEPFGKGFVYIAERTTKKRAARESKYGVFINVEEEESLSALYYVDINRPPDHRKKPFDSNSENAGQTRPNVDLSELLERPYKIESVVVSPGNDVAFLNCRSKDDGFYENDTYCFRIKYDPNLNFNDKAATSSIEKPTRIALPKGARVKAVSPDGNMLLISYKKQGPDEHGQSDLWLLDSSMPEELLGDMARLSGQMKCITEDLDQEPLSVYWTKLGIFLSYWNESTCEIAKLSEIGGIEVWDIQGLSAEYFHVNHEGNIFLRGASPTTLAEIYFGSPKSRGWDLRRITRFNEQFADWDFGTVESIKWTSIDGTEIEGILRKPSDFDPAKKYPLLFNVHGGPAAASPFTLLENNNRYFYPVVQLLNKGILILEPNYRGSLGRGKSYLTLNFNNLGIGDMWDLESAIDHLVEQGFVDETKIGSMGWSQGGYISAFLAMHSNRLKAASAGAALSSWRMYFSGSDKRQYILLSGDPYTNKEMFDRASPITYIDEAKTPILFQHGERDPVVPLVSAKEMYRALKARGVKTNLIVFPGQGHGLIKPRESYALMVQNYRWFAHFLLGEELDLLMDDTGDTIKCALRE